MGTVGYERYVLVVASSSVQLSVCGGFLCDGSAVLSVVRSFALRENHDVGCFCQCSAISHAIPSKNHISLFQFAFVCHLCFGIACDFG